MQDNLFVGFIRTVFVIDPAGSPDVNLDTSPPLKLSDLYPGVRKIRTRIRIPVAGMQYLNRFTGRQLQFILPEVLKLPGIMKKCFGHEIEIWSRYSSGYDFRFS